MYRPLSALAALTAALLPATASAGEPHPRHHHPALYASAGSTHSLTIGGRHRGIYRVGSTIVAPGGFGAYGYGYPVATPEEREEARNEALRVGSTGLYGYGFDGVGAPGSADAGYDNPYYGNTFNGGIGYGGLPSSLAFGPGFANRYQTDREPDDTPSPGPPSPGELGYQSEEPDGD